MGKNKKKQRTKDRKREKEILEKFGQIPFENDNFETLSMFDQIDDLSAPFNPTQMDMFEAIDNPKEDPIKENINETAEQISTFDPVEETETKSTKETGSSKKKKKKTKEKYKSKNTGGRKGKRAKEKKNGKKKVEQEIHYAEKPFYPNKKEQNNSDFSYDDMMYNFDEAMHEQKIVNEQELEISAKEAAEIRKPYDKAEKKLKKREKKRKAKKQKKLDAEYGPLFDEAIMREEAKKTYKEEALKRGEKIEQNYREVRETYNFSKIKTPFEEILKNSKNMDQAKEYVEKLYKNRKISGEQRQQIYNHLFKNRENLFKDVVEESTEDLKRLIKGESEEQLGKSSAKKIFNSRSGNVLLNTVLSISDYKDARNEGKGVVKSAAKAGALFVAGEVLQGTGMFAVMAAKQAPQMIVHGIESLQKTTRGMNSMTRFQTFGEAEFHDTHQLATMRQAGMELAKMSQYNLQQSMMGNEAQYMHRI